MPRFSDSEVAELLKGWTVESPKMVGEGMEGAVYSLGSERVAKVWFSQSASTVCSMKAFYDALAAKPLSFEVPELFEVREVGGLVASSERRFHGNTLREAVEAGSFTRGQAQEVVVGVLTELARSGRCPEAQSLSVMDEEEPLWGQGGDFSSGLVDLARHRAKKFGNVLAAAVEDFDRKADALLVRLTEVDSGNRTVIHGDLVLPNLLLSTGPSVGAVLDWGFFSTEGDPVFEAAVAASIFEMYGDDALKTEMAMYDQIEERLGYARTDMLVYRAAYSLITANAYDPGGNDGHFAWCAAALNRPDVVAAIRG